MTDPMTRYHKQFSAICDEIFSSVVARRPMRPLVEVCGTHECDKPAERPDRAAEERAGS